MMEGAIVLGVVYLAFLGLLLTIGAFFWLVNKAFDVWDWARCR